MGFTFDDSDADGVASPIAEMHKLIEKDPRNSEWIFPYLGGEEVNASPTQSHQRNVINFGEMTEEEARRWPDLMSIVETKVKPERDSDKTQGSHGREWWCIWKRNLERQRAIRGMKRVLVNALYGPYLSFAFLPAGQVFNNKLIILPFDTYCGFTVLFRVAAHEIWARFFSFHIERRPCVTRRPIVSRLSRFPKDFETNPASKSVGRAYHEFRAAVMVRKTRA